MSYLFFTLAFGLSQHNVKSHHISFVEKKLTGCLFFEEGIKERSIVKMILVPNMPNESAVE